MTYIRRLALKISDTVVDYASPGCKEWAEALAREVTFVEGDWAALGWALGSARVLFHYRQAPIRSFADLSSAAQKFAEAKLNNPNVAWIATFGWFFFYAVRFFGARNWPERTGCSLAALGFLYFGIFVLIDYRLKVPPSDDIITLIQFYRAALEQMHRSSGWSTVSVATLLLGQMLAQRGGFRTHPYWDAVYGLIWVGAVLLFLLVRRINRRRLEQVDVLLAEKA
jgi:hypothetical protein